MRQLTESQAPHQLPASSALGVAAHDEDDGDDLHDALLLLVHGFLDRVAIPEAHGCWFERDMHSNSQTHKLHTYLFLHIPHRAHSWSFDHKCQITKSFTNFQTLRARQSLHKDDGTGQATINIRGLSFVHSAHVTPYDHTDSRSTQTALVICQPTKSLLCSGNGGSVVCFVALLLILLRCCFTFCSVPFLPFLFYLFFPPSSTYIARRY